jgi:hypothetical protein
MAPKSFGSESPLGEPEPFFSVPPHSGDNCPGNCRTHPLVFGSVAETIRWMANGATWGDIVYYESLEAEAKMTDADKAARAARDAAAVKERELDGEAAAMFRYAEAQKLRNTVVVGKGRDKQRHTVKHQAPCKWLYCDEKAPKKDGKAPLRNYLTGAQCWAYEYNDPRTHELKKPHTCGHLHPGEVGWLEQWNKDRHYKEGAGRFDALKRR